MEEPLKDNHISTHQQTGRGCCVSSGELPPGYTIDQSRCCKLSSFNWLSQVASPPKKDEQKFVEIRFKNDRKDFFVCPPELELKEGEIVAVEASPGHDIGIVALTGEAVGLQMKRKRFDPERTEMKKVYRHARSGDIEKWLNAVKLEDPTMFRTRKIASGLGLEMKVNDVEYQGDKTKAIFYYTANERIDFRQLIRHLADEFRVRVEMRQIGVRQEAAKLGGIGSCGRELCCASHMSSFKSVSTNAARVQQLSLNPQKLAGQCGKLKCCLNFELESYQDALSNFPDNRIALKTKKGQAYYHKSDVFQEVMWYAYADDPNNLLAIPVKEVKKIIEMNKKRRFPDDLESFARIKEQKVEEDGQNSDDFVSYV
jgi:cell fate regulator YaaT (PSP1 superfamily)